MQSAPILNDCEYMKVVYLNCGYEKKKIQACTGFEHMNSAIKVQRSTNWANKPPGS